MRSTMSCRVWRIFPPEPTRPINTETTSYSRVLALRSFHRNMLIDDLRLRLEQPVLFPEQGPQRPRQQKAPRGVGRRGYVSLGAGAGFGRFLTLNFIA